MRPSFCKILLRSLLISYLLSGIFLLLLSFARYKLNLSEPLTNAAIYIVYTLSCFAGGFFAGKMAGSRRFFWGLLVGICYALLLIILSLLLQGKNIPMLQKIPQLFGCCIGGGIIGGVLS